MKMYKSTEQEVGKKDKKLKDIENSKSAANQRSAIDNLNRQLQDERKVAGFLILPPPPYTHTRTHARTPPLTPSVSAQALGSMRLNVAQVGQRCLDEHEKCTKAAVASFLHSAMAHHATMLQLTTEALQEVSKLQ